MASLPYARSLLHQSTHRRLRHVNNGFIGLNGFVGGVKNPINPFNPLLKKCSRRNPFNPINPLLNPHTQNPFNPINPLLILRILTICEIRGRTSLLALF